MLNHHTLGHVIHQLVTSPQHDLVILQIPPGRYIETINEFSQTPNTRILVTLPTSLNRFDLHEATPLREAYHTMVPQAQWVTSEDLFNLLMSMTSDVVATITHVLVSADVDPIILQLLESSPIKLPPCVIISMIPPSPQLTQIFPTAPIYQVDLPSQPIEIRYLPKTSGLNDPHLLTQTASLVAELHASAIEGDFIVFLATPVDAKSIYKSLTHMQLPNAAVVPVFKSITDWNLLRQPLDPQPGTESNEFLPALRKIYITTNPWMELIPIDPISVTIDTLVEPQLTQSPLGSIRWSLRYETVALANQRSNRLGKIRPGLAYRLGRPDVLPTSPPEVGLDPRDIIALIDGGFDPKAILAPTSSTRQHQITVTITQMIKLGLLESNESTDSTKQKLSVTDAGKFITAFPLNLRHSTVVWRWYRYGYPIFPCLAIMAMLDVVTSGSTFVDLPDRRPNQDRTAYIVEVELAQERFYQNFGGYSDVATLLNLLVALLDALGGPDVISSDAFAWCQRYRVNYPKIQQVLALIHESRQACTRMNIDCPIGPFVAAHVLDQLRPILAEVNADWLMQLEMVASIPQYRDRQGREYRLEMLTASNNFSANPPVFLIALVTTEIIETYAHGSGTRPSIINLAIDVDTTDVVNILESASTARRPSTPRTPREDLGQLRVDKGLQLVLSSQPEPKPKTRPEPSTNPPARRQKSPRRSRTQSAA